MIAARSISVVIRAAASGDQCAWERVVLAFAPTIRTVARRHRLSPCDQDEVAQCTWLALLQHIHDIKQPAAIGAWLATTAQRESLRLLQETRREVPVPETPELPETEPDDEIMTPERCAAVRQAFTRVSGHQLALLQALMAEPALSYAQISARLEMPVGSIGPTRQRTLARLRRDPRIASLIDDDVLSPRRTTRPPRPDLDDI